MNKEMDTFLEENGIQRELTGGDNSASNGTAERMNRTLKDMTRCEMYASGAPINLWGEAIVTAAFVQNVSYSKRIGMTPYEAFTGFRPDVSILRPFGCRIYFLISRGRREAGSEFLATSVPGIFLGYSTTSKGYRVLIFDIRLGRNRVIDVRMKDTKFYEKEFPYKINMRLDKATPPREYLTEDEFKNMFSVPAGSPLDARLPLDPILDENEIVTVHSDIDPWSMPKSSVPSVAQRSGDAPSFSSLLQTSPADQGVSIGGHQLRSSNRRLERMDVNHSGYFSVENHVNLRVER